MMRDLDFCMLTTHAADGGLHARPMSNNGEVEFDGDVWFFSEDETRKVADIENFRFLSMTGTATIVRDAGKKRELWMEELERWFDDGPDSEEIVLIKVTPTVVEYWNGEEQGEIVLD